MSATTSHSSRTGLIVGIDPGLSTGGVAVVDPRSDEVLTAHSIRLTREEAREAIAAAAESLEALGGWGDREFTAAALRARAWVRKLACLLDEIERRHGAIGFYAIESFTDQPSRARRERAGLLRQRWQTPLVISLIHELLAERRAGVVDGRLVFQNAGVVLRQHADDLVALREGREIVKGAQRHIRNEHTRSALVHALALSQRLRAREGKGVEPHPQSREKPRPLPRQSKASSQSKPRKGDHRVQSCLSKPSN
jgi:hypothetical protein